MGLKLSEEVGAQRTQTLPARIRDYSSCLAELLGSSLRATEGLSDGICPGWTITIAEEQGLFLPSNIGCQPVNRIFHSLNHNSNKQHKAGNIPGYSILLARQPRWPLRNILLVLRGHEEDQIAIEWTIEIARLSSAKVTILPVIPDIPGFYTRFSRVQVGQEVLLLLDTTPGVQLRQLFQRLFLLGLEGNIKIHRMPPDEQIRVEVQVSEPDLLIISAEHRRWLWRFWMGELVQPLLRWIDRPVLIARPERLVRSMWSCMMP